MRRPDWLVDLCNPLLLECGVQLSTEFLMSLLAIVSINLRGKSLAQRHVGGALLLELLLFP